MRSIIILDTSIFLKLLKVPVDSRDTQGVLDELEEHINRGASLLLPIAAIIETGNRIARLDNGNQRRHYAGIFIEQVSMALAGDAPWQPTAMPDTESLVAWLADFPDQAMRGISIADLTLIKEWEAACERHPRDHVRIWSLDQHLTGYDRRPAFHLRSSQSRDRA